MSNLLFQDPAQIHPADAIEDRALPSAASTGMPLFMTLAIAGCGLVAGGPVMAVAAGLVPGYLMLAKMKRVYRAHTFTRANPGCIAHLIDNRPDMVEWIEICGHKDVKEQLLLARRRGQPFTSVAKIALGELVPAKELPPQKLADHIRALREIEALEVQAETIDEPTASRDRIPNALTYLGDPGTPKPAGAVATKTAIAVPVQRGLLDRMVNVGGFLSSRLIVGASRSGKSQLASDAIATVRKKHPNATIYYVSAGCKPGEDSWYWNPVDHFAGYNFLDMRPEEIRGAYEHWLALLDGFDSFPYSLTEPKIFIVDELDSIMKKAGASESGKLFVDQLKGRMQSAASMGAKSGYVIWGISPVAGMASLDLTRDQASTFNPVFVAIAGRDWNQTAYINARSNGLAPRQLPQGFPDGTRVVGIGGEWEALPESPKLAKRQADRRNPFGGDPERTQGPDEDEDDGDFIGYADEMPETSGDPVADKILDFIKAKGDAGYTLRELQRGTKTRRLKPNAEQVKAAVDLLVQKGMARVENEWVFLPL